MKLENRAPHKNNKQMLRCRLAAGWSLLAKLTFWSVVGIEIVAFAFKDQQTFPLFASMLGVLFLIVWLLWEQEKKLQRIIALFLDAIAIKQGFLKLDPEKVADARAKKSQANGKGKEDAAKPARQAT